MMEFFNQGGYAGFVWGAFGMTFGLLLIEVIQLRSSRKSTLTRIRRLLRLRTPKEARAQTSTRTNAPSGTSDVQT